MEVRVTGTDLRRVAIALRAEDARLPGLLRRRLIREVRPWVQRVKANARAIPVHGAKHTGLRRRVAAGVHTKVRTGRNASIVIATRMAERDEAIIPRGMDSPTGWRHPVFGNRDNWVTQRTGGSWFRETLANSHDDIQRSLTDVLEDVADRIADAGGPML
jgi:hypothetical protein